jgi:hypothetical protein
MARLKELIHIMRQHSTVTFTLHGLGESIFECSYFDKVVEEFDQLEAKTEEFDRREKGVVVMEASYYSGGMEDYMCSYACGNCKCGVSMHYEPELKYCNGCGTKLIWDEVDQC